MQLTWLTDIHLNFLEFGEREQFYQEIVKTNCNGVLISGDIAEAPSVANLLKEVAEYVKQPVYFILGNHDYYRGQVDVVKEAMTALTKTEELLHWLPASGPQMLTKNIILLGQDGWADGRYGDYDNSLITLNDSRFIVDLIQQRILGKYPLLEKMQELADIDAKQLHGNLVAAISQHQPKKIIVLTHVPPFKEACMHQGRMSDDDWLPYFSSKATGDVLSRFANDNPATEFLVLCGHTHSEAFFQPLDNLIVKAGKAEYYQPQVQEVISI